MNMFFFKWISPEEVGREWRVTQSLCLLSSSMYSFWMTLWPSGTPIRHSKTPPEWKMLLSRITDVICNCPIDWSMISMCGHQVTDWIQLTVAWSRISRWFCCLLFVDIDVFLNHVFFIWYSNFQPSLNQTRSIFCTVACGSSSHDACRAAFGTRAPLIYSTEMVYRDQDMAQHNAAWQSNYWMIWEDWILFEDATNTEKLAYCHMWMQYLFFWRTSVSIEHGNHVAGKLAKEVNCPPAHPPTPKNPNISA